MPEEQRLEGGAPAAGATPAAGGTDGAAGQPKPGEAGTPAGGTGGAAAEDKSGGAAGAPALGADGKPAVGADGKPAEGGAAGEAKAVTPTWPTDWRQQIVGTKEDKDGKLLKQLERFASPADLFQKIQEQDKLISSGTLKQPLAKDATPEQIAEYRKANNIPETPDKYDMTLPNGLVIGEVDKPILNNMLAKMHAKNLPQDVVKDLVADYFQQQKDFVTNQETLRNTHHTAMEDTLRKEWGDNYRSEVNRIEGLLNTFSAESQAALQFGVDNKGMRFLDNPNILRDLALQARIINPVSTITPAGGGSQMDSVEGEIAAIELRMGGGPKKESAIRDAYFKDAKAQARYLELVDFRERQKPGGKAA